MMLNCERKIENSVMMSTITISGFGNAEMDAATEKEILLDYKIQIPYANMIFSRLVQMDDHKNPTIVPDPNSNEEVTADRITLVMPDETYELTPDLELKYAVDITTLTNRVPYYSDAISNEISLGKAMILVWETTIADYISQQMEINRKHKDNFETTVSYIV